MTVKAQHTSTMKDCVTLCRPSKGYRNEFEIDLDQYIEDGKIDVELPESDQTFPLSAPFIDVVKVGDKIFKKRLL